MTLLGQRQRGGGHATGTLDRRVNSAQLDLDGVPPPCRLDTGGVRWAT
ncbi:MAG TPA: hypothetical protein VMO17_06245 [Terriglobia bacterium]|nr:hypothetical protein [Terriglobia bacterium]